jgi:DNA-binding response OmpR family regulator
MRVLVVEDDPRISQPVADFLRRQRHVVDTVSDGETAFDLAQNVVYELLLIDIGLPKLDGLSLCAKLRENRTTSPIMMLTARDAVQDKVDALDAGADDYLTKPFELAELGARVRALGRRANAERKSALRYGAFTLDRARMRVEVCGRELDCTRTEFAILETMLRSPRQVFSREMLLERVSPLGSDTGEDAIKTHVGNLRRKIRAAGHAEPAIETLYGYGYRLADP